MAPRLRVLAGPSPDALTPITHLVNTDKPFRIASDAFDGQLVVHIKGLTGTHDESTYFERPDRKGVTWSLQMQGRFLQEYSADDVLFGNTFDRPLKLPWGSGAALKFMAYVDPTLEHDLTSQTRPWALSPLVATMPHFAHMRIPGAAPSSSASSASSQDSLPLPTPTQATLNAPAPPEVEVDLDLPPFPPNESITDDTSQLHLALREDGNETFSTSSSASTSPMPSPRPSPSHSPSSSKSSLLSPSSSSLSLSLKPSKSWRNLKSTASSLTSKSASSAKAKSRAHSKLASLPTASARRSYFASAPHRQPVVFGPSDVITTDFCYGFLEFAPSLSLKLPGGVSFDLLKYWDGQPVRFVCCERGSGSGGGGEGVPWGRVFWCVAIEMGEEEEAEGQEGEEEGREMADDQGVD